MRRLRSLAQLSLRERALYKLCSKTMRHVDEEYMGDHWATGNCPMCRLERMLGLRSRRAGGISLSEHLGLVREHFPRMLPEETDMSTSGGRFSVNPPEDPDGDRQAELARIARDAGEVFEAYVASKAVDTAAQVLSAALAKLDNLLLKVEPMLGQNPEFWARRGKLYRLRVELLSFSYGPEGLTPLLEAAGEEVEAEAKDYEAPASPR